MEIYMKRTTPQKKEQKEDGTATGGREEVGKSSIEAAWRCGQGLGLNVERGISENSTM